MITLIKNKTTDYCIAIPKSASVVEKTVSGELAEYIEKVYGVKLSIVSESEAGERAIYVGHTDYAKSHSYVGNSTEHWMVCADGKNIVLTGGLTNKDRGVSYSVYHFLEDVVGIRWWTWFEEYIPQADTLAIPDDYKNGGTPYFEYRNIVDTLRPIYYPYVLRNRLNSWTDTTRMDLISDPEFTSRGCIKYIAPPHSSHTVPRWIPIDDYYDEHPEWFAYDKLTDSRPRTPQHSTLYCLKNPGFIEFTAKKVMDQIEECKRLSAEYGIDMPCYFDVTLSDAQGHCECDECCKAVEKGGRTGYVLQYVNEVAKIVGKKYPGIMLHTEAYWDHIEPPLDDTMPAKNVLLTYADLKVDLLRDIASETNKKGKRDFDVWAEKFANTDASLYIWDFALQQYPNCMMPYFLKFPKNFRYFCDHGIKGFFVEHQVKHTSDFWTMTQWLLIRMMEDPLQDFDALVDDFTTRYYGAAAPYIKEYIGLLEENLEDNACRIMVFEQALISNYVNYKTMKEGMKLLLAAEKAVEDDALRLRRLHTVMSCFYRTLALRYEEFETIAKRKNESINISKADATKKVIAYLEENRDVYLREGYDEHNEELEKAVDNEIAYMKRFLEKEKIQIPVPEELKKFGEENIYCVSGTEFYGLAGCGMLPDGHAVGESIAFDEELGRKVLKISTANLMVKRRNLFIAGKRTDEIPNPIVFYTEGNHENVCLELCQEDLYTEQYHLYHVGDVENVSAYSSTMFRLFSFLTYCIGISNLYEYLPSDKYGIYIHIKPSGLGYGGDPSAEESICIDSVFIVKK